jgi:hypothetical protein
MCKKERENQRSSIAPLQSNQRLVGINIPSFRVREGHTPTGGGAIDLLKKFKRHCNLAVWKIIHLCLMWCI